MITIDKHIDYGLDTDTDEYVSVIHLNSGYKHNRIKLVNRTPFGISPEGRSISDVKALLNFGVSQEEIDQFIESQSYRAAEYDPNG